MLRGGTVAALVGLLAAAPQVWALSLGRLNVQSALGEPLRAEIDVTSITPEEASYLQTRVAPQDAYRSAGVDYNAVLPGTKVVLQRRADGRPFLKLSSDRAVQEPFVDVILEMTWASGRLVREYTLLFDPPTTARPAAPTEPVATAPALSPAPVPAPESAVPTPAASARAQAPAPAPRPVAPKPAPVPKPAPAPSAVTAASTPTREAVDSVTVRAGDTLYRVATKTQQPSVSLDQMLIGLYRANPDAFVGNNMNRLKAGAVLQVPSAADAQAITTGEARRLIRAQARDFNQYRRVLAGAVAPSKAPESDKKVGGKVEAQVQDNRPSADAAPDKLTLSKGAVAAKASGAAEQKIADARARADADNRVKELARNLDELKKLKGGVAGAAPAASAAASASVAGVKVPVVPPVAPPVVASAPLVVAAASKPAVAASKVVSPKTEPVPIAMGTAASKPAPAVAPPPEDKPASAVAAAASEAAPVPAPMADEPGLLTNLLDSPFVLPGAAGLVALLAGLGLWRMRARRDSDGGETSFLESRLQPDSFFGASGGQRVDTHDASGSPSSSMSYSLSQLDAIGDVDPVAEADVYLAYGRDLQAEEILKEAMRANPDRLAIRTKLLEVYAKRRDTKGFELLAGQLYAMTHGTGDDWAQAQSMGASIDADNPLYQPGGKPLLPQGADTDLAAVGVLGASTMPQSVLPPQARSEFQGGSMDTSPGGLDLDLDVQAVDRFAVPSAPVPASAPAPLEPPQAVERNTGFQPTNAFQPSGGAEGDSIRLDLPSVSGVDFAESGSAAIAAAASVAPPPPFDFSGFSLDLDTPPVEVESAEGASVPPTVSALDADDEGAADPLARLSTFDFSEGADGDEDPMSRKMDLAEEFLQIGDVEGARDLLREVVSNASGALKAKAQTMLDDFS